MIEAVLAPQNIGGRHVVWAANGINRPDEKKRIASSAQNAQEVDLYLFMKDGVYVYDTENHELDSVLSGDFRMI